MSHCSIPSLMWAASLIPDSGGSKCPSMQFLEERVAKLEQELAEKDGETSRLLRAMEQQCNQSKVCLLLFMVIHPIRERLGQS